MPLAVGAVCRVEQTVAQALALPVQEARTYVQTQPANGDETTWWEQMRRSYLWVAVTHWVSVFVLRASRGAKVLRELVGEEYEAVLTVIGPKPITVTRCGGGSSVGRICAAIFKRGLTGLGWEQRWAGGYWRLATCSLSGGTRYGTAPGREPPCSGGWHRCG